MAAYRALTAESFAATDTFECDAPASIVVGEQLFAFLVWRPPSPDTYGTLTAPAGWTLEAEILAAVGGRVAVYVYSKVAGGSEPATYTWSTSINSGTRQMRIYIATYETVSAGHEIADFQSQLNTTDDSTAEAPNVLADSTPTLQISFHVHGDGVTTGYHSATTSVGAGTIRSQFTDSDNGGRLIMALSDVARTGTGTQSGVIATAGFGSTDSFGFSILLRDTTYVPPVAAITVDSVDGDGIVRNSQTSVAIVGSLFGASQLTGSVTISQPGVELTQTVNSWADELINIDIVYETGGIDLSNGPATLTVVHDDDTSDSIAITITEKSGEKYITLLSLHSPASERIVTEPDIDGVVLGQFEFRGATGGAAPVTLVPVSDGRYYFTDSTAVDFQARFYDRADNTWGAWGVILAAEAIDPEEPVIPVDPEIPSDFASLTSQELQAVVESNTLIVSGITTDAGQALVAGGSISVNGGSYTAGTTTVRNGDVIKLSHLTANRFRTSVTTNVQYGGVTRTFTSTTRVKPPQGGFNLLKKFYRRWR